MKKVNLVFFLPNFGIGGAGKSITSLCHNLNRNKFSITIICLKHCYYKKILNKACTKIYELNNSKASFAQLKIKKILEDLSLKGQKTIFISNLFYVNALTAIFQKKNKYLKFIFTERTTLKELDIYFNFFDFIKKKIIKVILKLLYKRSDLIISNSKKVAKEIKDFSKARSIGIYPGSFSKIFFKKKFKKKNLYNFISIGRLSKEKGYDLLIKAVSEIDKRKYKLQIIGEGPERDILQNLINKFNLKNNVKLLGLKKNIYPFLKKADLSINCSYFEGFPNVVIESLSCGVPVLCSESYGGINEILDYGKYGNFFKNGNCENLKKNINKFLINPKIFFDKAKLSQKNLIRFSEKKSSNAYEKIFLDL